jgi:hypothetical protein
MANKEKLSEDLIEKYQREILAFMADTLPKRYPDGRVVYPPVESERYLKMEIIADTLKSDLEEYGE